MDVRTRTLLAAALFAVACNSKSPEKTEDTDSAVPEPSGAVPERKEPVEEPKPEGLPSLESAHHVAFDLLANRPLAHRIESLGEAQAVVVDASAPDFVRYIHGNHPAEWKMGLELDGVQASALKKKRKGSVWVPSMSLDGPIQIKVFSPRANNALTLKVNGKATSAQALAAGWNVMTFDIPEGALAYENEVELDFSNMGRISGSLSGGGLAWIRVGASAESSPVAEAEPDAGALVSVPPDPAAGSLAFASGQGSFSLEHPALWNVWILPESKIEMTLGGKAGCGVRVRGWGEDGESITPIFEETRTLVDTFGDEQKTYVDVSKHSGIARVELAPVGCDSVQLVDAALVVPGKKPVRPEFEAPKYVVFWMIDTLRADHLPIHFETNVQAPNLKRLAAEGASFKLAFVQGNESKTSHASLFSGMFPTKHRVVGRGSLKPPLVLMPEAIQAAGYRTGAYISNGYVSKPWGFVQGWNFYVNNLRENYRIDGRSMAKMGLKWIEDNNAKSPLFLYLGTIDPHVTYRRHEELIGKYDTEPYNGRFQRACYGEDLGKIKGGGIKVTERDKVRIQNLYKNEVEFNDIAFGELRAGLETAGLWDKTMVVVTADHGDEFWEHGSVGHGHSLYQDQVHVPFIVYYPPAIPKGTVVEAGVDVLDAYPTIVDVIGAERPADLQGRSALPLIHKMRGDYPEPAAATQYKIHYTMQMQQWKLYLRRGEYQLYDRANDHFEKKNVADKHPIASRWLLDSMGWFRAHRDTWDKASWGAASNLSSDFLKELPK